MALTSILVVIIITLSLSIIHSCSSMVVPSSTTTNDTLQNIITTKFSPTNKKTTSTSTYILRIRKRNSFIETLLDQKQLQFIEFHLRQKQIPYHRIHENNDGITIVIGSFYGTTNSTIINVLFNQAFIPTDFANLISIKSDYNNQTNAIINSDKKRIEDEFNFTNDQESHEFRNCLEGCEIYQDDGLKPDHNCIRKKCLKEITGI